MQFLIDTLVAYFKATPAIDILAVITGIIYVILAARNHIACWFFGILSSALTMYSVFFLYHLYLDTFLQACYVAMGIWGWMRWQRQSQSELQKIRTLTLVQHLLIISVGISLSLAFGWIFQHYTSAAATYLDAFTTVFALLTTVMVTYRILENWLYWVVIDTASIYLFASRGGHFYTILFGVYVVVAIMGYLKWRQIWLAEKPR